MAELRPWLSANSKAAVAGWRQEGCTGHPPVRYHATYDQRIRAA